MIKEAKVLKVDLSNKRIEIEMLSCEIYRKYPGGSELAMYLLLKNIKPNVDS